MKSVSVRAPEPVTATATAPATITRPRPPTPRPLRRDDTRQDTRRDVSRHDTNQDARQEPMPIYSTAVLTRTIQLPIKAVNRQLKESLETVLAQTLDGTCIVEGFVKPGSIQVLHHSSGLVHGSQVVFDVAFNVELCLPIAGMQIPCMATSITKAGVRSICSNETPSPVEVFIVRDYSYNEDVFNDMQVGDLFIARVISQRFEITDTIIRVVAQIVKGSSTR